MSTYHTIYQRASDEVAQSATITIETGTDPGDTNYGPASLVDGNPAKVAKIDDVTGAWLFEFGAAQRIDLAALIHHNFDAGAAVVLQGNTSNSWGSPIAFEAAITIPAWLGSGTTRWPVNAWVDLTEAAGYSATGYQYWRLLVTGNSQNLQLGEIWLGATLRQLDPDLRWEYTPLTRKPIIENKTSFEVSTVYTRGTTLWRLSADLRQDDALLADLEAHWYDVDGRTKPWLLIPSPPPASATGVIAGQRRPYLVRYAGLERSVPHLSFDVHDCRLEVEEVARGLRPGV